MQSITGATGWTVIVVDALYKGAGNKELDFAGKAVFLKSLGGAATCVIDCEGSGRGIYFHTGETSDAIVQGFTIRNGSDSYGGGIRINGASPTIRDCVITGCTSTNYGGGGIYCNGSASPTITDCAFTSNTASGTYSYGGGLVCSSCTGTVTVEGCTFTGNRNCK